MLTISFCSYGDDDDEEMTGGLPPPRLFCDICDVFDEHDTDDCPLQAASDSPPHSMHHGKRAPGGSDRPYCDNCEGTKLNIYTCTVSGPLPLPLPKINSNVLRHLW